MSKGKRLAGGVLLLALIALTFYLLLRNQPVSQLLDVLGRVKPGYVVLGLLLGFLPVAFAFAGLPVEVRLMAAPYGGRNALLYVARRIEDGASGAEARAEALSRARRSWRRSPLHQA